MTLGLRKRWSLSKKYWRYTFESEQNELADDVVRLCSRLNRGFYIIEVFFKDTLNHTIFKNNQPIHSEHSMLYYLVDTMQFLCNLNVADLRHLCVYSVSQLNEERFDKQWLIDHYSFAACFENYLDTCEIIICKKHYTNELINQLFVE